MKKKSDIAKKLDKKVIHKLVQDFNQSFNHYYDLYKQGKITEQEFHRITDRKANKVIDYEKNNEE